MTRHVWHKNTVSVVYMYGIMGDVLIELYIRREGQHSRID